MNPEIKCEGYCNGYAEGYTFPRLFTEMEKGPKQYCKKCYYSMYGVKIGMQLRYKKLDPTAVPPKKNNPSDAGYDLNALNDTVIPSLPTTIIRYGISKINNMFMKDSGEKVDFHVATKIPTGIALEIPHGYFGQINDRSGLGSNSIKVFGGQIDSTYRGDVTVCLMNFSFFDKEVKKGDRIAQIMILPVASPELIESEELTDSDRGSKGFGSSGLKEFHE